MAANQSAQANAIKLSRVASEAVAKARSLQKSALEAGESATSVSAAANLAGQCGCGSASIIFSFGFGINVHWMWVNAFGACQLIHPDPTSHHMTPLCSVGRQNCH